MTKYRKIGELFNGRMRVYEFDQAFAVEIWEETHEIKHVVVSDARYFPETLAFPVIPCANTDKDDEGVSNVVGYDAYISFNEIAGSWNVPCDDVTLLEYIIENRGIR